MKHFSQKRILALLLSAALLWMMTVTAVAAGGLEMSTDYPGITAKAGDDLTYSLDFYNGSGAGASVSLSASNLPEGWEGYFTGSGNTISRVYVRAGDNPSLATFNLKIPEDAEQGTYTVTLDAVGSGMSSSLELELVLAEADKIPLRLQLHNMGVVEAVGRVGNGRFCHNRHGRRPFRKL